MRSYSHHPRQHRLAEIVYRDKSEEEWLEKPGLKSDIQQREPKGRPMPEALLKANGRRPVIMCAVEHTFPTEDSIISSPDHRQHGYRVRSPAILTMYSLLMVLLLPHKKK